MLYPPPPLMKKYTRPFALCYGSINVLAFCHLFVAGYLVAPYHAVSPLRSLHAIWTVIFVFFLCNSPSARLVHTCNV